MSATRRDFLEHLDGVRDGIRNEAEAINGSGGFAGKTEDEGGADTGGEGTGEDGVGGEGEAFHAHHFAKAGQFTVGDFADGLGRDVAPGHAGTAGGEDEMSAAGDALTDGALDGGTVVGHDFLRDDFPTALD